LESHSTLRTWTACSTPVPWAAPATPGPYQLRVWARSSGSNTDYPETSARIVYDLVPDVRGTYTGIASGNTLTFTFAGGWRDDIGACNVSGSFTGTRWGIGRIAARWVASPRGRPQRHPTSALVS